MLLGVESATVQTPYDRLTKDSKLGLNIRLRREELNLTQVQLADLLGQTKHWVSERECGYVELRWQELEAIAGALQCRSDELKPR